MELKAFATEHRCRRKTDECGDLNVLGRRGTIYEYGSGLFAATVIGGRTAVWWNKHREALKTVGCKITQNGDTEGTALFDPENQEQVKAALEAIRAFRKRTMTDETRARLIESLQKMRERARH